MEKRHKGATPGVIRYIYTDGGCSGNPGPGGWAWITTDGKKALHQGSGGKAHTTNNEMELQAVLSALQSADKNFGYIMVLDSQYVIDAITKWRFKWAVQGWTLKKNKPIQHLKIIQQICTLVDSPMLSIVKWEWIRGHTGDHFNELADQLADQQTQQFKLSAATEDEVARPLPNKLLSKPETTQELSRIDELEKRVTHLEKQQYKYA